MNYGNVQHISKEKVKNALTLYDVASHYTDVKTKGKITYFLCPFHNDKHIGSTYFYNDKDKFICHSCGAKGDVLTLASGFTQIPLSEMDRLLEQIINDFGLIREHFISDDFVNNPANMHKYPLDETEHYLLFGPNCEKEEFKDLYSFFSIKNKCKTDYSQYIKNVRIGSRIFYRKCIEKIIKYRLNENNKNTKWDEINLFMLLNDAKVIDTFSKEPVNDDMITKRFLKVLQTKPFNIYDYYTSLASVQLRLLKKALPVNSYKREVAVRKKMFDRKYVQLSTVKALIEEQKKEG